MPARAEFDVAIAGASIAGCTAARLFALAGARVALVEQRPDPAAHKVVCTHQIQSSAVPTIERLGLAPSLERAGAVRSRAAAWTPYGGWLLFPPEAPAGYAITRRRLDPLLRELATHTPGIEYFPGYTVSGLLGNGDRVQGIEAQTPGRERLAVRAKLTVAADGRDSTVARLARVPARVRPHNRFAYFAYWKGLETPRDQARLWMLDPDGAAVFPNEDDLTLVATVPHKARLPEFRADAQSAYRRMIGALPEGPDFSGAEQTSKLVGKLDMPNKMRRAAQPGLAFVGDASLAADPLFGVGCGWAFQTAEWLVEAAGPALFGHGELDGALARYRRVHLRRLGPHHMQMNDFSTGRPMRPNERLAFQAAAADPVVAAAMEEVVTRRKPVSRLFDPRLLPRVLRSA